MRPAKFFLFLGFILALLNPFTVLAEGKRARDYGIKTGILPPGPNNAITDVKGVTVGHYTLVKGDNVRTGVTAILPHPGNIFRQKVPAAVFVAHFLSVAVFRLFETIKNFPCTTIDID
jgi:D-aminopeptidase